MSNFENIIELLKELHKLREEDFEFLRCYVKNTRLAFEKELQTRTRQKKGKKEIVDALASLDRFEKVFKPILGLKACMIEDLISQAEDLNCGVEITKLYAKTEEVNKQVSALLSQQLEASKAFNSRWTSTRRMTAKERRNELVYTLWKAGKTVNEIKEVVDAQLESEGEKHKISRQTIYTLIGRFKKSEQ